MSGWEQAAHNYWQGIAHPSNTPIWERIVEGHIAVWSMHSRQEALKEIEAIWPQSLNILRYAVLCAGYGSIDGQMFPMMLIKEDRIELNYYLRLAQRGDPAFIGMLNKFIENNPKFNCGIHCEGEEAVPDLSGFSKVITPDSKGSFGNFVKQILQMKKELPVEDSHEQQPLFIPSCATPTQLF